MEAKATSQKINHNREAGKVGMPVKEVYKGWQNDYNKGINQDNENNTLRVFLLLNIY